MSTASTPLSLLRAEVLSATARHGRLLVTSSATIDVLKAFKNGQVSSKDVAEWAEFIDANEDVDLEENSHLPDVFFELSSPEINGLLDVKRATEIISLLSESRE